MRPRTKGLLFTLAGTLCYSPDALLIRLIQLEPFAFALLRGLAAAIGIGLVVWWLKRSDFWPALRRIGRIGLLAAVVNAVGGVLFIFAFAHTSVANVLVYMAAQPFLAAVISRLLNGERLPRATLVAMAGGFLGIGVVVAGGVGTPSLIGDGAALLSATFFAGYFALLRKQSHVDMMPVVPVAGVMNALLALPLMFLLAEGFQPLAELPAERWGWIALISLLLPAAMTLTSFGPRYLPAAEVSLLILLETVLGPALVWAILGEVPPQATLLGGAIVLLALLGHTLWTLRLPAHAAVVAP